MPFRRVPTINNTTLGPLLLIHLHLGFAWKEIKWSGRPQNVAYTPQTLRGTKSTCVELTEEISVPPSQLNKNHTIATRYSRSCCDPCVGCPRDCKVVFSAKSAHAQMHPHILDDGDNYPKVSIDVGTAQTLVLARKTRHNTTFEAQISSPNRPASESRTTHDSQNIWICIGR